MLEALRASSQTWIGRSIMAIVMGFLIIAFGFWGIADIFRGFGANTLAQVGSAEITGDQFRNAYQTQLLRMQERARRPITNDEARQMGLDRQVLGRLLSDSVLDQEGHHLGLAMSNDDLARRIMSDDDFKGAGGQFDRATFEAQLRDAGLTEQAFTADQRGTYLRDEILSALNNGLTAPRAMLDVINRYYNEIRSIDYIVLPKTAAGTIPAPTDAQLKTYFDAHRDVYRKPEYRKISVLVLTTTSLAKAQAASHPISDADVKKRYDEVKDARYTQAEQRQIQQVVFPDEKSADAASAKLAGGETFDALVAERKLTPKDIDLGTVTQSSLLDKNVAAAAFALSKGAVSKPVKTQFGWAILHVVNIMPKIVIPFIAVKESIAQELALFHAHADLNKLHDQIEDQRASGKSVADAAKSLGLEARTVDALDAEGHDKSGKTITDLGEAKDSKQLLKAVFASDVGVDNEPISTSDGGAIWFDVLNVDPARGQTLDEVKPRLVQDWTADQVATRLTDKTTELAKKLDGGATLASIASGLGNLPIKHVDKINRSDSQGLSSAMLTQVFDRKVGASGSAEGQDGSRILFKVVNASVGPLDVKGVRMRNIVDQMKTALNEDMVSQYVTQLETRYGTRINDQVWQSVSGAPTDTQ